MKNLQLFLIAADFLVMLGGADKLSADLNAKVNNGSVTVDPSTHFVRKDISGASSIYDFIDEQTDKIDGISSIKSTSLPKNQAFIFHGVAVGYSEGTTASGAGAQTYSDDLPAAVRNANLLIRQNGREVLNEPIANFAKGEATTRPSDYYFELPSLRYLKDDEAIEIKIVFPKGVALPDAGASNSNYMEVRLLGQKTVAKI